MLDSNFSNPGFIYEALKVYLMLGGQQPADRGLIVSWMRRDWADNLYRGAADAEGRKLLEDHLVAMLDLETGPPLMELDGRIVKESQDRLARMSVAQRAYELLKSQSRSATGDWIAARRGGNEAERVFEAAGGQKLDTVRVPEFFTYNGFHKLFIGRLGDIAETVKKDRWVLGPAGDQGAVATQYDNLLDEMLAPLYARVHRNLARGIGQAAAAQTACRQAALRRAQRPFGADLAAQAAPRIDPRRDRGHARARQTATGGRRAACSARKAAGAVQDPGRRRPARRSNGSSSHSTSQSKATEAAAPIDDLIGNLNQIANNLQLLANPMEAPRANAALQALLAALQNSAARMPRPFSDMMRGALSEFEGDVASSTAGQLLVALRDQVLPECRRIITERYPFTRGSDQDVPLADFGRLFGAGGLLDAFFKQNLQPHADTSQTHMGVAAGQPGDALVVAGDACSNSSAPRRSAMRSSRAAATPRWCSSPSSLP